MDRYSLEEPPRDEPYDEEGTAESRRVGIAIALVGLLMMTLSVLGGWSPWSLQPWLRFLALADAREGKETGPEES
jgi:hypothetical protein